MRGDGWEVRCGGCVEALDAMPEGSVDLVFADPPYFMRLRQEVLLRNDRTPVRGVREDWDRFEDGLDYARFTREWLRAARRVLRPGGALLTIGSYHNVYQVGAALQDLGFWILNDVVWVKENPMPNFKGRRLTNAHETLIWAAREEGTDYTFNYDLLKAGNEDKQLRSDWSYPLCGGRERLRNEDGTSLHTAQKPLALLVRALTMASRPGDLVVDPFLGSGTTGEAAVRLGRRFVGVERDPVYAAAAAARIAAATPHDLELVRLPEPRRPAVRVPFSKLVDRGMIAVGAPLTCPRDAREALVRADGTLVYDGVVGSIHQAGARAGRTASCNGWSFWHYGRDGRRRPIDHLRRELVAEMAA